MDQIIPSQLNHLQLKRMQKQLETKYRDSIEHDTWTALFRGRDILIQFASTYSGLRYEDFRTLIIARMQDMNLIPEGMRRTLENAVLH